jgi:hypothetical protein
MEEFFYIKKRLDNYLEFDSDLLFKHDSRTIRIFGGAIRDILANMEINDIDIVLSSQNKKYVIDLLLSNGYKKIDKFQNKNFRDIYKDIKLISEPHTYINTNLKIVQIITPTDSNINIYEKSIVNLLQNVDLSCCGLSYDGNSLIENYKDAYYHAVNKVFVVNEHAMMYSMERNAERIHKLEKRGWRVLNKEINIEINRCIHIDSLLENKFIKSEYTPIFIKKPLKGVNIML